MMRNKKMRLEKKKNKKKQKIQNKWVRIERDSLTGINTQTERTYLQNKKKKEKPKKKNKSGRTIFFLPMNNDL